MLSFEGGGFGSHYVEESFWRRLWTCRQTDHWIIIIWWLFHYRIPSFDFRSLEVCRSHCDCSHWQMEQEIRAHDCYFWPLSSVRLPEHRAGVSVWHERLESNHNARVSSRRWLWAQCSLGSTEPKNLCIWRFYIREHFYTSSEQQTIFLWTQHSHMVGITIMKGTFCVYCCNGCMFYGTFLTSVLKGYLSFLKGLVFYI